MIDKDLLSAILGEIIESVYLKGIEVNYIVSMGGYKYINIYELANMCKEKAKNYGYTMFSGIGIKSECLCTVYYRWSTKDEEWDFKASTEPEAIFKAFNWILARSRKQ